LREYLLGPPLPTRELGERRLNKIQALAAFSPDALSSIAYANQEIFLGLVVAGSAGLALAFPVALAIVAVLLIATLSYYQTVLAYPSGGGSWIVARANLGLGAGLVAAAGLLLDYVLTAAVSLSARVEAIASAFPALWPHRDETDAEHNDGQQATLVLPEFVPARWWQALLHNQTAWLTKAALLYHRRITGLPRVVIDVPYYLRQ
jgi:amino acid transporter